MSASDEPPLVRPRLNVVGVENVPVFTPVWAPAVGASATNAPAFPAVRPSSNLSVVADPKNTGDGAGNDAQ